MQHITSGKSLRNYLTEIINETLKSKLESQALREEENQLEMSDDTPDKDSESLKKGDIKAEDIIDKLNSIRSGKSFKDEAVSSGMKKYISALDKAERVALLAFLKAIAQLVTGEIEVDDVDDPSDPPAGISMKKTTTDKTVKIKPTIIKPDSSGKKSSEEDTSGPAPIKPKK
jgi:hypothetical protein